MTRAAPTGEEYRRMVAGQLYLPADPELLALRTRARSLALRFNTMPPEDLAGQAALFAEMFGSVAGACTIEKGLHVDYGINIHLGANFYANANCVHMAQNGRQRVR